MEMEGNTLEILRAENTRLRASLARTNARVALFLFYNSPTRRRLLAAFRQWLVNTKTMETLSKVSYEVTSIKTQRLQLESQRHAVSKIQEDNWTLRGNLYLTLYFYRWKVQNCEKKINEDRSVYKAQKENLLREIILLKNLVASKNRQEAGLVCAAKERGVDFVRSLHQLEEIVHDCTVIHTVAREEGEKDVDLPPIEDHAQVLLAQSFNSSNGDPSSVPLSTVQNSFFSASSSWFEVPNNSPKKKQQEQIWGREEKEWVKG